MHDRRSKTLASEIGDLAFSCRRARDRYGNTVVPLADFLDLPWCARVTPGARSFLVEAGADVSYQKAANLMARHGSRVSATTVMNSLRTAGALCAEEDAALEEDLLANGVTSPGEIESGQVLVEADVLPPMHFPPFGTAAGILDQIHPMLLDPSPFGIAWGSCNPGRS